MSRGKKSQQSWACGPPRHCLLFFVAATSPKSQQKATHVVAWVRFLPSQFLGRQKPIKQAFFLCHFFGTSKTGVRTHLWVLNGTQLRSEWAPCLPMGAEWVAIAIRTSPMCIPMDAESDPNAIRQDPMHPDVCGMGQNMQPQIPIHVGSIWITVASHWTQTGRHAAILTGRHRHPDQAWRNVCSG